MSYLPLDWFFISKNPLNLSVMHFVNTLTLMLRYFVDSIELRYPIISALNESINDKFNQAGIVIAFPQRDLHLDMRETLHVHIETSHQG